MQMAEGTAKAQCHKLEIAVILIVFSGRHLMCFGAGMDENGLTSRSFSMPSSPSSVWRGSIVPSLISIPVRMYAAARSERTYLHQIHKECNSRLRQPLFCATCNRFVERGEIVKGFEFDEGQYVLMEDQEIKKLAARSSRTLEILAFTKLGEIDPLFFDSSYFRVAEDSGKKACQLLVKAPRSKAN